MTKRKDPKDLLKRGRHTEMTPEKIAKLEQAFSIGCSDLEACLFADIGKTTLYTYQNKHPEFTERKERLKEGVVLKARIKVKEALDSKDLKVSTDMAKWLLERKKKDEFSTRVENDVIVTMTDEEVNEVEAILFGLN